jgi:hypothetical protein
MLKINKKNNLNILELNDEIYDKNKGKLKNYKILIFINLLV